MKHKYLGNMVNDRDRQCFSRALTTTRTLTSRFGPHAQPQIETHVGSDADALCAQKVLRDFLIEEGFAPKVSIGPVVYTARLLTERLKLTDTNGANGCGMRYIVDTSAKPLLNGAGEILVPDRTVVVDHHVPDETTVLSRYMIRNIHAISTCEMLASLIPAERITREQAFALAVGVAGDSERLRTAEGRTIAIFERLLRLARVKRSEIDELADPEWDPEITQAIFRDMSKASCERCGDWVVAVGFTELSTPFVFADALRKLNANITAAITELHMGAYKISFRVSYSRASETGVWANDIAKRTSMLCDMPKERWGGGHIDRSSSVVECSAEAVLSAVNTAIRQVVGEAARK